MLFQFHMVIRESASVFVCMGVSVRECVCVDDWVGWRVVSLCAGSCHFLCTVYGQAFHLVLGGCKLPAFQL